MSDKFIWKNAEIDSNDAIKPKSMAQPTEDELRNALRSIRNWRLYLSKRKQELGVTEAPHPAFLDLEARLNDAETNISDILTIINEFDDL